jgi:hypothetical protein
LSLDDLALALGAHDNRLPEGSQGFTLPIAPRVGHLFFLRSYSPFSCN